MTYRMPLALRRRMAGNKRDRYHRDPDYRLQRINEARTRRRREPYRSLDEVKLRII
jgi:hypothetical protein